MKTSNHRSMRVWLGLLGLALIVVSGLVMVAAQSGDGRVNPAEHVGGAAVYCVDSTFTPADHWSDGGIRVLDANGQELLFTPAADIIAGGDPPTETLQVGSGANAYGGLTLFYRPDSKFVLTGVDEHGKDFEFVWGGCGYTLPSDEPLPEVTVEPTKCFSRNTQQDGGVPAAIFDPCLPG
jgi:hypothetical protein